MEQESRTKKSLLNAKVNMICYTLGLFMTFFSRKIFIDHLGAEFLGLTSTLSSLLGFLNLAELGVGQAISVVLYKPIYDKNQHEINEIISVLGYLYRLIGLAILIAGVGLSCFLPMIFPQTDFSWSVIYLGFYSFLLSSLLGYFCNYKQNLLWADQKGYEVTGYFQAVGLAKTAIQIAIVYYMANYVLYLLIEVVFGIIYAVVLRWRVNIVYPWLNSEIKLGKKLFKKYPTIGKYIGQLFIHKVGSFVQFQITPLLIYGYVSLAIVTFYNNYVSVAAQVKGFIGGVLDSTGAGIGSLIAEGHQEHIFKIYKQLLCIRYYIAGSLCCSIYFLASNFISVWLGKQYVLSDMVVLLICVQTFFNMARGTNDQFSNGYALFADVWAPFAEAIIFVVVAMLLGSKYGLTGVLWGPVASLAIIVNIWKPYYLFSKGLRRGFHSYCLLVLDYTALLFAAYLASRYVADLVDIDGSLSWKGWIIQATIFASCMFTVSFVLFYFLGIGMKGFVRHFISSRKSHGS